MTSSTGLVGGPWRTATFRLENLVAAVIRYGWRVRLAENIVAVYFGPIMIIWGSFSRFSTFTMEEGECGRHRKAQRHSFNFI